MGVRKLLSVYPYSGVLVFEFLWKYANPERQGGVLSTNKHDKEPIRWAYAKSPC